MAGQIIGKRILWNGNIDSGGYRTYKIAWKIQTSDYEDGPTTVMLTPGLYLPGSPWEEGNDYDPWVWCRPDMDVKQQGIKDGEASKNWVVEQTFSNKPISQSLQRCQDVRIEDPLLEPPKLSGGFVRRTREATRDRFGNPLFTSSWEQMRGQTVEFDNDTDQVKIEFNSLLLPLDLIEPMKNTVNAFPLWGLPPRTIKLSEFTYDEKWWGLCYKYYTLKFGFDIDANTFDRLIPDEGTKVLNGHWNPLTKLWEDDQINGQDPNPRNPTHFIRFTDLKGNASRVILDGNGRPYNPLLSDTVTTCDQCPSGAPRYWKVRNYDIFFQGSTIEQTLIYSSGCTWGNATMTLEFEASDNPGVEPDQWILTDLASGAQWVSDASDWECNPATGTEIIMGFNPQSGDPEDFPSQVAIGRDTATPGYRYIQYYPESDFLLLGIPIIL